MTFFKAKTFRSPKYLEFVRTLPCVVCGAHGVEAHHAITGGVGIKGSDGFAIPLCPLHHREHDNRGKVTFYREHNLDRWELVARTLEKYLKEKIC